jgi:hypothetical protein
MAEQPKCTTSVDGLREWYLDGKLHRVDGPALEWDDGTKEWWLNGKLHREDGPAIERPNGIKEWWLNGMRHRVDGPAIEWVGGVKEWYLDGFGFSVQEYWASMLKDKPVGTLIARSWGSCLKLSQTSFLLCDFAQKSLTLLDGA